MRLNIIRLTFFAGNSSTRTRRVRKYLLYFTLVTVAFSCRNAKNTDCLIEESYNISKLENDSVLLFCSFKNKSSKDLYFLAPFLDVTYPYEKEFPYYKTIDFEAYGGNIGLERLINGAAIKKSEQLFKEISRSKVKIDNENDILL